MHFRAVAHGDLVRQVLLHGDLNGEPRVFAQVRRAEAADSEDPHHVVGTKPEAGRQRLLVVLGAHGGQSSTVLQLGSAVTKAFDTGSALGPSAQPLYCPGIGD